MTTRRNGNVTASKPAYAKGRENGRTGQAAAYGANYTLQDQRKRINGCGGARTDN